MVAGKLIHSLGKVMQKSILITGCSSGIGLVAAQDLKNRGYRILAACRKLQDVEKMALFGLEGIELDLDDSTSVERAAAQIIALTNGRLYGLFNNGGFGVYGSLQSISRQQLEKQFATNLFWNPSIDTVAIARHVATR